MSGQDNQREEILRNIQAIFDGMDDLERTYSEIHHHIAMNDAFFLYHRQGLADPDYGSIDELVELYLDTCSLLARIQKAQAQFRCVNEIMHYYNYKSSAFFKEANGWYGRHL